MHLISREQAVCIFYCKAFNEANVAELFKRIDEMKDVEICYLNDPTDPILACTLTINSRPFYYHLYTSGTPPEQEKEEEKEDKIQLVNNAQVIQFLNSIYLPTSDPKNNELYEQKSLTNSNILSLVWKYTDLFDNKTVTSFSKWCSNKADFTAVNSKRKQDSNGKVSARSLYVAKDNFIDDIAKKIVHYLPHYQSYIEKHKSENYPIVGYARKSKTGEDMESRVRLLKQMGFRLKERSLVDKIFVSLLANADDLLLERDFVKKEDLLKQLTVDGDAQGKEKAVNAFILTEVFLKMNCSRDFALCVLFGMEFTPANVIEANSKLESYGDLEVCYDSSERSPILVPRNSINYDPFTYKRYLSTPPPETIETADNTLLTSDSQLSQFVNAIFSHLNLENNENYELKSPIILKLFNFSIKYTCPVIQRMKKCMNVNLRQTVTYF